MEKSTLYSYYKNKKHCQKVRKVLPKHQLKKMAVLAIKKG